MVQLAATSDAYAKLSDYDLDKAIEKETSFNFRKALTTTLAAARNLHEFHACLLKDAMDGIGHNSDIVIRILTTRSEVRARPSGFSGKNISCLLLASSIRVLEIFFVKNAIELWCG